MKAVVCDRYGPPEVLRLDDVPRPAPGPDEVLIKIRAAAVNRSDTETRAGTPPAARLVTGLRRPRHRILGTELAGVVEAAGPAVTEFTVGDDVFGVKAWTFGAHAEYVCMRHSAALAHKPAGLGFEEAAAVCDGVILALMGLRPAGVRKGRSILVYGASGSIGTAAVQLSRYFGADVTAVCGTKNLELLANLGADQVIDYTREDFTKNGQGYDVIFKVIFPIPPRYTKRDVLFLKGLMETGQYRAVIDKRYPLAEVVEANRYVDTGQKTGNVVLTVG